VIRESRSQIDLMDADIRALGRSFGAHSMGLGSEDGDDTKR
jgi:hypothetical protein